MKSNKGFTLIELIIVTVILGILAAVAVPRFMGTVNRAEAAAEDAVLNNLRANAENYAMEQFIDTGRKSYPTNPFEGADIDGYTSGAVMQSTKQYAAKDMFTKDSFVVLIFSLELRPVSKLKPLL